MTLTVVRGGEPTDAELAAVLAALAVVAASARDSQASHSAWADRAALLRAPLRRGPDAWRRSPH